MPLRPEGLNHEGPSWSRLSLHARAGGAWEAWALLWAEEVEVEERSVKGFADLSSVWDILWRHSSEHRPVHPLLLHALFLGLQLTEGAAIFLQLTLQPWHLPLGQHLLLFLQTQNPNQSAHADTTGSDLLLAAEFIQHAASIFQLSLQFGAVRVHLSDALPVDLSLLCEGLLEAAGLFHPLQRLQLLAEHGVALLQDSRPVDVAVKATVELLKALPALDGGDAGRGFKVHGFLIEDI
ncbi:hypothetical protein EYF80_011312 [Liparis tanakae]|uniref:Uncharacterized protein n=1 Tax=Liparis tanakae TaxID=230148 RepID=A0A4Z2IKJ6_9TELE|nr:hypothetical protein EYF80_011312 [Liparis tanakae]